MFSRLNHWEGILKKVGGMTLSIGFGLLATACSSDSQQGGLPEQKRGQSALAQDVPVPAPAPGDPLPEETEPTNPEPIPVPTEPLPDAGSAPGEVGSDAPDEDTDIEAGEGPAETPDTTAGEGPAETPDTTAGEGPAETPDTTAGEGPAETPDDFEMDEKSKMDQGTDKAKLMQQGNRADS